MRKNIYMIILVLITVAFVGCNNHELSELQLDGDCSVETLKLDEFDATIDLSNQTIDVLVPEVYDVTNMTLTSLGLSAGASSDFSNGMTLDMTESKTIHVTNGSMYLDWTLTVTHQEPARPEYPVMLFVGDASTKKGLDAEALTACNWMLENVKNSDYASFDELKNGKVKTSACKIIWWHYHKDGGVDGHDRFQTNATKALAAKTQLRSFYENGGSLLLTRYATYLPSFIGVTGSDEYTVPNNCWGQNENEAELCSSPWWFYKYAGQENHPLFDNLVAGDEANGVYCTDNGYHVTNSTAQYHIGSDWGGYNNYAAWQDRTGGLPLGVGGDGAIVAWEYPASGDKGGIICIGSGCYDWYSYTYGAGYEEKFHKNIGQMTLNAINYLTGK